MSSKVFLSYRRSDASWAAIVIASELQTHLGEGSVFRDLESISLGRNWQDSLDQALDECEVALILIGPTWVKSADAAGAESRLMNPDDMVRREIERSLERGIPVIPVLLDGTRLPSAEELPEDLRELIYRQGVEVRFTTYQADVTNLVQKFQLHAEGRSPAISPLQEELPSDLPGLLVRFLSEYRQWSFSSSRISKWGGQQNGFERLSQFSVTDIRAELDRMVSAGQLKTRQSKKGGTLYTLA